MAVVAVAVAEVAWCRTVTSTNFCSSAAKCTHAASWRAVSRHGNMASWCWHWTRLVPRHVRHRHPPDGDTHMYCALILLATMSMAQHRHHLPAALFSTQVPGRLCRLPFTALCVCVCGPYAAGYVWTVSSTDGDIGVLCCQS